MSRLETSVQILSLLMMQQKGQLFPKKQKYFGGVAAFLPSFSEAGLCHDFHRFNVRFQALLNWKLLLRTAATMTVG